MKLSLIIVFSILLSASVASSQTLYGVANIGPDGPSTLYRIGTDSGTATPIGPVGFERCGSLAFDDSTQTLFAVCERTDGSDTAVLVNIDHATGAGTEIGDIGVCRQYTDISFRNSDNNLFATGFGNVCGGGQNTLVNVNTATGMGTFVGPMGNIGCCGNAMAFSPTDTLFYMDGDVGPPDTLYTVNQATGAANIVTSVQYPAILDRDPRPNAMAFHPSNKLFVSIVNGGPNVELPKENYLGLVNTSNGNVRIIGPTVEGLDGIAFGPAEPRPIPTLSEWGLIAMASVLGIIGLLAIRRRKAAA